MKRTGHPKTYSVVGTRVFNVLRTPVTVPEWKVYTTGVQVGNLCVYVNRGFWGATRVVLRGTMSASAIDEIWNKALTDDDHERLVPLVTSARNKLDRLVAEQQMNEALVGVELPGTSDDPVTARLTADAYVLAELVLRARESKSVSVTQIRAMVDKLLEDLTS